jgi:hypothetical protein
VFGFAGFITRSRCRRLCTVCGSSWLHQHRYCLLHGLWHFTKWPRHWAWLCWQLSTVCLEGNWGALWSLLCTVVPGDVRSLTVWVQAVKLLILLSNHTRIICAHTHAVPAS